MNGARFLLVALVLSALVVGCGERTAYRDADGNQVTVNDKTGEVTVKTQGGTYVASQDGKQTTVRTADGKEMPLDAGTRIGEEDLGLPFYPGSTDTRQSTRLKQGGQEYLTSVRTTPDGVDKVVAFYKGKVRVESETITPDLAILNSKLGGKPVFIQVNRSSFRSTASTT